MRPKTRQAQCALVAGGERNHLFSQSSQPRPQERRLEQLFFDVHRCSGFNADLDLPGIRQQPRRESMVHGMGSVSAGRGQESTVTNRCDKATTRTGQESAVTNRSDKATTRTGASFTGSLHLLFEKGAGVPP